MGRLSFYDHARQSYADAVPCEHAGEIMVGDYCEDGGVGSLGEFRIVFYRFKTGLRDHQGLTPQLRVFSDAFGALRLFMAHGGADLLEERPFASVDEVSRRLIALGLADCSENPLSKAAA